ncbi:F-box/LRR-repeat protein 16 [Choanephora cucurbitarum]|uniref:F-box/LRR-repeat protein 16 n=1 Tax=Choanephora cucurbitarum TaxID=101091 RepID=A0A1C7N5L5_9FUNG|nr:F-box/LRR-repeat protein 16 [Choanephora cucurbitarum]
MQAINDNHLAYLLSLGFELELCQQALRDNATLEDATEWILNPNRAPVPKFQKSIATPSKTYANLAHSDTSNFQRENEELKQTQLKKSEKFTKELKKAKHLEREAKRKVLADIHEDKERRRNRLHYSDNNKHSTSSQPMPDPNRTCHLDQAFVQLKLTNSSTVRQSFPSDLMIGELLDFVCDKEKSLNQSDISTDSVSLTNVFPRRTYTNQDSSVTLRDAGFLPNISLNVHISRHEESLVIDDPNRHLLVTEDMQEPEDFMEVDETGLDGLHRPTASTANRQWSRLGTGIQPTSTTATSQPGAIDSREDNSNTQQQNSERRSLFLNAIQHHMNNNSIPPIDSDSHVKTGLERHSKALKDICASSVSVLLSQHSTSSDRYLTKAFELPSDLAEYLIKHLKNNGKLNVSNLKKLGSHCYLQNILLDTYMYCTDSLIDGLSKTSSSLSISKVSLRGCDMITDNGISSLSGLKQLNYLDVSNCKLTDKGLKALEKLCFLVYLDLSKTKITSKGMESMLLHAKYKEVLQTLMLDGCINIKSSNTLVPIVNGLPNLIQLSLARTPIGKQEVVDRLKRNIQLRSLNISQTDTADRDLTEIISQFRLLQDLNLSGCHHLSTKGLAFLPTELKHLEFVQFPNNDNELDGVLARYRELPIKRLELSSFCITDQGAQYIACMKHLQFLNLEGTKVTDYGISYFRDLVELEKLYLDRTELTDEGVEHLVGLSKLNTLSLSHTAVTSNTLILISNYAKTGFTRCLKTLNLSQCPGITDRGVRSLNAMINLTYLNLDHTSVNLDHLKPVRLLGIEKEEEEEEELRNGELN